MKRPEALDTLREQKVALERLLWEADRHSIHTLHPEYVHHHRTPERHHEYQRVMADYLMRHGAEVAAILGIAPPGYVILPVETAASGWSLVEGVALQWAIRARNGEPNDVSMAETWKAFGDALNTAIHR